MAEALRSADLGYGHAGSRFIYTSINAQKTSDPSSIHTSRLLSNYPYFRTIGPSVELYPPSKFDPPQQTVSRTSVQRNLQRRWLLKSQPQAFMASHLIPGLLTEDRERFQKLDETSTSQPLLETGEIMDWSFPTKPAVLSVLATAAGDSGQLLRLARIDPSVWKWEDEGDGELQLSIPNPAEQEDEVVWTSDGLPISQIKYVANNMRYEPIRWFIVQKQTSTTILQPEYTRIPTFQPQGGSGFEFNSISRIDPNPLITINHDETGGNAHSDVAFNTPGDGRPPQMCIMDECGYWTLWNVDGKMGTRINSLRLTLYKCGHIFEGPSDKNLILPSLWPAEQHGALFVGTATQKDDGPDLFPGCGFDDHPGDVKTRADHLIIWNSEQFDVFNIESGASLPKLKQFATTKSRYGQIIDIRISPINRNHVFLLTATYLLWIDLFHSNDETGINQPRILLVCPHLVHKHEGLTMTITLGSNGQDADDATVFLYSPEASHLTIFWLRLEPPHQLPQWHRQVTTLHQTTTQGTKSYNNISHLKFKQSELSHASKGKASKYQQDRGQFFQGLILGHDLSVGYCICYVSENPSLKVDPPLIRMDETKLDKRRTWRKNKLQLINNTGCQFTVPDEMVYAEKQAAGDLSKKGSNGTVTRSEKPIVLTFNRIKRELVNYLPTKGKPGDIGIPLATVDALRTIINQSKTDERLPLKTWLDAIEGLEHDDMHLILDADTEESLHALFKQTNDSKGSTIMMQLERSLSKDPIDPLYNIAQLRLTLSNLWLEPLRDKLSNQAMRTREIWISELSRDLFLSTHAVVVQNQEGLFGDNYLLPSDPAASPPSYQLPPPSSQPKSEVSDKHSSAPKETSPNDALARLSLLAPSIQAGKLGTSRQAPVLSLWPSQRGISTTEYISSVAEADERRFDKAKARTARIESKRKAKIEKYKLPPGLSALRSSQSQSQQPLSQFHFSSQPFFQSSQQHSIGGPSQNETRVVMPKYEDRESNPIFTKPEPGLQGPQIMSSQPWVPGSSQSQGVPWSMSQPSAGAFGDRKKNKKVKKKSGFR